LKKLLVYKVLQNTITDYFGNLKHEITGYCTQSFRDDFVRTDDDILENRSTTEIQKNYQIPKYKELMDSLCENPKYPHKLKNKENAVVIKIVSIQ
jgi:hypothetical protein